MKTLFYERTAYNLSDEPVPNCFFLLDEAFDRHFSTILEAYLNRSLMLAEIICSRMADVELYAFLLNDARGRGDGFAVGASSNADIEALTGHANSDANKGAILMRSYMAGYLSACKTLLDSAAYTLSELYQLPIERSARRFENAEFWHQLVLSAPNAHRRYHSRRIFFREVVRWRDEVVERVPPIALLQGHLMRQSLQLDVVNDPSENLDKLLSDAPTLYWRNPMDLHREWKPKFLDLCERLCVDIRDQL
ncbi:MAG: hypothetical protein AAF702_21290 [Chloroflexota bacterium]